MSFQTFARRKNGPCPVCQPEGRKDQNALSITYEGGKLLVHCHKSNCAYQDIVTALGVEQTPAPSALYSTDDPMDKLMRAQRIWDNSIPIANTLGEKYLRSRGIAIIPDSLRFNGDAYHSATGRYHCMMVARVDPTGAIHRTFLGKSDGLKINSSTAKMMMGPCNGGAVRLLSGSGPLIVAEGIETALSVAQIRKDTNPSVWAALSASGIANLVLPDRAGRLVVASDGDQTGHDAARALMSRAAAAGWECYELPAPQGHDWNDVLQGITA